VQRRRCSISAWSPHDDPRGFASTSGDPVAYRAWALLALRRAQATLIELEPPRGARAMSAESQRARCPGP